MAAKFGLGEDDEDVLAPKEPQVTSEDPEERKLARRLRIKRRKEALRRANEPKEEKIPEEEMTLVEKTVDVAAKENIRLSLEAAGKVTNVKVMTDEREVERRTLCADVKKRQLEQIELEAAEAQLRYEAICENWEPMVKLNDPLDIDASMMDQKKRCDELLAAKNALIGELKQDLNNMDVAYHEDLDKQDKDIKELSERIQKEIAMMQRAYETQLALIEGAMTIEREKALDHNNKRWEALFRQRDREELKHIDMKMDQLDAHKQAIEDIMWDHIERFRATKIELETLLQELQKELEKLKAICLINTEKIGYNYQVLKKREQENVLVRGQQKRKLNKMNDIANDLRAKIRKAAEDGALEEKRADAEIVKLLAAMDDLEIKSNHFSHVNDYKFCQVWRMCVARMLELLRDLRQSEVAMHAHVLAEPPPPPPPPIPKSPLLKKWPPEDDEAEKGVPSVQLPKVNASEFKDSKDKLISHIFQLVADNTGFLVEDRLLHLIEKYQLTSRNLCTLDSIFMALEIQTEDDIHLMCETFLNYAFCPICVGDEDGTSEEMADASDTTEFASKGRPASTANKARSSAGRSLTMSTTRSGHGGYKTTDLSPEDQLLLAEADVILQKCGDPQAPSMVRGAASDAGGSAVARRAGTRGVVVVANTPEIVDASVNNPFLCPEGHYLEIEPMQVLTALGEFIKKFIPPGKKKLYEILDSVKPPNFNTLSRSLTTEEIVGYWANWRNSFPLEKKHFWDGLTIGLNKYLIILKEREKIHEEVVELRRRNESLRQLMRGSLPELPRNQVPPGYLQAGKGVFLAPGDDCAPRTYLKLPKLA